MIGFKDIFKLLGISIVACCAVFVCTLFLNYNFDLIDLKNEILIDDAAKVMYEAQVSMGKVIVAITSGCLGATSIVLLMFYIKNYIDAHGKELGILKAIGYSDFSVAKYFWVFELSVFIGCGAGFVAAFLYLPSFYQIQNADGILPNIAVRFHLILPLCLVAVPTMLFMAISVFYALLKLKTPPLDLMLERSRTIIKHGRESAKNLSFLQSLKQATIRSKKLLVFFVAFSAFCFSAMVQMSLSMTDLASETMAWMIFIIGLILSFVTLLLSLSNVVKGNTKTIAMMRVFGYDYALCSNTVLGSYRLFSYVGFMIGTLYQYGLLKLILTFVFSGVEDMPTYNFNWSALLITLVAFLATYELIMLFFSLKIKKQSLKSVMME